MSTVGLLLLALGVFLMIEALKNLGSPSAASASGGSGGALSPQLPTTPGGAATQAGSQAAGGVQAVAGSMTEAQVQAAIQQAIAIRGWPSWWADPIRRIMAYEDPAVDPTIQGFDKNDPNNPPTGLMQVKANIHGYTAQQLTDPVTNIIAGVDHLIAAWGGGGWTQNSSLWASEAAGIGY